MSDLVFQVSDHDKRVLDMVDEVLKRFTSFCSAFETGDPVALVDGVTNVMLEHISNLIDFIEDPELKAAMALELATTRVMIEENAEKAGYSRFSQGL